MIGGISTPPVEAQASTPPAYLAEKPSRFIAGMVSVPVVSTLVTGPPDIEPNRPEENTATLAGPPRTWPSVEKARLMKKLPAPVYCSAMPKMMKPNTSEAKARIGMPSRLSMLYMWNAAVLSGVCDTPEITSGIRWT